MRIYITGFVVLTLVLFVGCGGNTATTTTASTTTQSATNTITCDAVENGTPANNSIPVSLTGSGGSGSYVVTAMTLSGIAASQITPTTSFASTAAAAISGYFPTSTAIAGMTGEVTIADAENSALTATCPYTLTTSGTGTTTGTACTLTPSATSVPVNQSVTLSLAITAGWGVAPYTLTSLVPGTSYAVTAGPTSASGTTASVGLEYTVAGVQTPSATIKDSAGNVGTCTTTITVTGTSSTGTLACSVTFSANPAAAGAAVTVTANVTGGTTTALQSVNVPGSEGITGSISSTLAAELFFPTAGSYPIDLTVVDLDGQEAVCQGTLTVN